MNHRATFHPRKANNAAARRRAYWVRPFPIHPSAPLQRVGPGTRPRVDEGLVRCDTIPPVPNTRVAFHLCCGHTDKNTCSSMEQIQSASPGSRSSLQRDHHRIADDFARLEPTPNDLRQTTAQKKFRIATSSRQVFKLGWVCSMNGALRETSPVLLNNLCPYQSILHSIEVCGCSGWPGIWHEPSRWKQN